MKINQEKITFCSLENIVKCFETEEQVSCYKQDLCDKQVSCDKLDSYDNQVSCDKQDFNNKQDLNNKDVSNISNRNFVVISGDGPESKFLPTVTNCLAKHFGVSAVHSLTLPSGETSKNLDVVKLCWDMFSKFKVNRSTYVIAIGGGSITDTVGFAASTYLRGVKLAFVPTTITCAIDAAIGGKNGVNIVSSDKVTTKNQIGNFYCADKVVIDTEVFSTLSRNDYLSGFCEVVKTALISDTDLLETLQDISGHVSGCEEAAKLHGNFCNTFENISQDRLISIILKCIQFKQAIVHKDPLDTSGQRAILNYGHTIGHAIEAASDCKISHGMAVAAGMDFAAFVSEKVNNVDNIVSEQRKILLEMGISVQEIFEQLKFITNLDKDELICKLMQAIKSDKKIKDNKIAFITLKHIKKPAISWLSSQQLNNFLLEYKSL